MRIIIILFLIPDIFVFSVHAGPNLSSDAGTDSLASAQQKISVTYGNKGWEFGTTDGNYLLHIESRLQFRYAYPFDSDPVTHKDFGKDDQQILKINRARLKIGGNVFQSWLKYYWEYELAAGNLLDFRMMIEKYPFFKIKVGQWKVQYNRERIISSGKQQLADRSLINRYFTVDRQQGVSFFGHLKDSDLADFYYWAGAFMGTGRGAKENDDTHLMYMLRTQWNFLRQTLKFSGSDLVYHEKGAGLVAIAAVTNRSPYTSFSQAGGGELPGFEPGEPGQYRVNQAMLETAIKYRGFSWQQELHWKEINDYVNNKVTILRGNYIQFGYFLHYGWALVPKPLEISLRHAIYDPDSETDDVLMQEYTIDFNWYFNGHRNKLNAEFSYFNFQEKVTEKRDGYRIRLQWDVSM